MGAWMQPMGVVYEGTPDEQQESCNRSVVRRMGWLDPSENLPPESERYLDVMTMQYDEHICDPQMLVEHRIWIGPEKRFMKLSEYFKTPCPWAENERVDYWMPLLPTSKQFWDRAMENAVMKSLGNSPMFVLR